MPARDLVTIPSADRAFQRTAKRLAEQAEDVEQLADLIKRVYPKAHVSAQDPLGTLPGTPLRVYIYRDGMEHGD